MSAALQVRRSSCAGAARPSLHLVVDAPAGRPRRRAGAKRRRRVLPTPPFVVLALLVLGAGLAALLGINTVTTQESFQLHQLQQRGQSLTQQEQALRVALLQEQAPNRLADRARRLGMVPAGGAHYLTVKP
jgi:cell division protein FtsB